MSKKKPDYRNMSVQERIKLVEQIYIDHPKLDELQRKIDNCREFSKISAEPECILLTGPAGAGKSTLIKRYMKGFPPKVTPETTIVPVLTLVIPIPATVKSLATNLLAELGDTLAEKGNTTSQTLRLRTYLKKCKVELIILDEFQHFIDRKSLKVIQTLSDWLKNLLNDTAIPLALIGMPNSDTILDAKENVQLKRRFTLRETLEPFSWETVEQQTYFRTFLKILDESLPFMERSQLSDFNTAALIYTATAGVMNNVMNLIRRATALALQEGMEKIDLDHLAQAYEQKVAINSLCEENPFGIPTVKRKRARKAQSPGSATNRRVKGRKKKLTPSDVLKQR